MPRIIYVLLTLRFTGHKRNTGYGRSAFNDEMDIAKAARLLCSGVSGCWRTRLSYENRSKSRLIPKKQLIYRRVFPSINLAPNMLNS